MKGTKGEQPTGTDAEAVRNRRFHDVAVQAALASGRLTILRDSDGSVFLDIIKVEIESYPQKEIGIFAHSNAAVSDLADQT